MATGAFATGPDMNESFTKEFLSCSICWESYDDRSRQPKLLSCHHTFCKGCLKKLVRSGRTVLQVCESMFREWHWEEWNGRNITNCG